MYISAVTKCLDMWVCTKQPSGNWTLDASPDMNCYEFSLDREDWFLYAVPVALPTAFYIVLAIPLYIFFILRDAKRLDRLYDQEFVSSYGWLFMKVRARRAAVCHRFRRLILH